MKERIIETLKDVARNTFRYIVLPTLVVVIICVAFDIKMMNLSSQMTAYFFGLVSIARGILKYDNMSTQKIESAKRRKAAQIEERAEALLRQAQEMHENKLWWDENFSTVMVWADEIERR